MNTLTHITFLCAAVAGSAATGGTYAPGLTPLMVTDARTDRPLEGVLWYPADAQIETNTVQSNPVWAGVDAATDAQMATGEFPLLVISHGMYGNMMNQNWLASEMAKAGYVVAIVNHPGTSTWLRDADQARQIWERPQDISRMITHLTERSEIASQINQDRIYMAGHSLGGMTAVALAGGRIDPDGFDAFCARGVDPFVCGIMDRWGIANTPEDRLAIARDYSDDRIKAYAVFDLGGTQFFSPSSLGSITADMLVMGAVKNVTQLNLDYESRALAQHLQQKHVTYLEPATVSHFDFLGICTDEALTILKQEEPEDVIVCEDGITERARDHAFIVQAVKRTFSQD